jgi:hypothetical protein
LHLIQILLPLYDNGGRHFPSDMFAAVRETLTERFGGMTAFTRAPAEGVWKNDGTTTRDDIVILEGMAGRIDKDWWRGYREHLESTFEQDVVVIRSQPVEML